MKANHMNFCSLRTVSLSLSCLLFIGGCSSQPLELKESLIQPFSYDLENQEPFQPPFYSVYSKGDRKLIFVAAAHSLGPDNATFRTILNAFDTYSPKYVIVEGQAFTTVSDPAVLVKVRACQEKKFEGCPENTYALHLASKRDVAFGYGEPPDRQVMAELAARRNTEADAIVFYGLRQIPQWKREGFKTSAQLKTQLEKGLPHFAEKLGSNFVLTFKTFSEHYKLRMAKPFRFEEIDIETVSPQIDKKPTWINLISHEVGLVRESFLIKQIEKRLNDYQTVLVVYGLGHLVKERKALLEALPSLETVQPFPPKAP